MTTPDQPDDSNEPKPAQNAADETGGEAGTAPVEAATGDPLAEFDPDAHGDTLTPDPPRKKRRIRRLHFHLGIWSLTAIGLLTLFLVLASMSLTGRTIVLPDFVAQKVLATMNAAMPSGSFTLRRVEFGVTPKGRPMLRLVDVGIKDATGLDLAQLNGVESGFRIIPALEGRLEPTVVRLTGAQVTLRRLADGTFALSLGQQAGTSGDLAAVLDSVDTVFTDGVLKGSELVEATDLTITLEDARVERLWQVTDGRMKITQTDRFVDTEVSFDVFNQTEELAHTVFSFRSDKATSEASLAAKFDNAAARDIALQSPALTFLSVIDAPISGALRSSVAADGTLSELAGVLSIGSGALSPTPGAPPAAFNGAKVYIDYDPAAQRLDLLGASLDSGLGTAEGEGHFYLADFQRGLPNSLIGQITLSNAKLVAPDLFEAPLTLDRGIADFRIRLDPFTVEIGQAVGFRGRHRYAAKGTIGATSDGWSVALDAEASPASPGEDTATGTPSAVGPPPDPTGDKDEALAVWPLINDTKIRDWFRDRVERISLTDAHVAFRRAPGGKPYMDGDYNFTNALVTVLPELPPVQVDEGYFAQGRGEFSVVIEKGHVKAPDGSIIDLSGTTYRIADTEARPQIADLGLQLTGPLGGVLSLIALPPFNAFAKAGFGPDVASGQATISGTAHFPVGVPDATIDQMQIALAGKLTDVRSDKLVKDRLLIADSLDLSLTQDAVELTGPVQIGRARASGLWHQPLGHHIADGERPVVTGTMEISDTTLSEFDISLPDEMLTGAGPGRFTLDFPDSGPMKLHLLSDLGGVGLAIPGTGWTKAPGAKGNLELDAVLGPRPEVTRLSLSAPGLEAKGKVTTAEGGGLGEAQFSEVKLGGWFDGGVAITGRGADQPVGVAITSGTLDMRKADLGTGGGSGGARGPKRPLTLALDRLIVSEGIKIDNLKGDFDLAGGLSGTFSGKVVGGAPIDGTVAPQGGRSAFRITAKNAGAVLRGAGVFGTAKGGHLELVLAPVADPGTYEGQFTITGTQVVQSPAMLKLLSAVSVVGLIDQMNGEGISFSDVEGRFRLTPDSVTLYKASAVGVSLGISLDGYYDLKKSTIDMQGVLSPFYLVNALGRIVSPRKGEGLIGFNFTLKGGYDNPEVQVNPLSILTPGAFREIFRRPPPEPPKQ